MGMALREHPWEQLNRDGLQHRGTLEGIGMETKSWEKMSKKGM